MYAPIIIPTLNRYDHLVRCIDSLKKNPLACETELYVSLDYPPTEKYREGYERVKGYLENELTDGFKNIHKYYQKENLGSGKNGNFLIEQVYKTYDRYIFTEDDNEFSPNVLDYLNKGLNLFEEDEEVLAVCGYRNEKPWEFAEGNVAKICLFHAWGYATWKKKDKECRKWICRDNLTKVLYDKKTCDFLYHTRYKAYCALIEAFLANPTDHKNVYISQGGEMACIDYTMEIYMLLFSKYCILPKVSMVRNWGYDGTGINCGRIEKLEAEFSSAVIDDRKFFEYHIPDNFKLAEINKRINKDEDYKKLAKKARRFRTIMCTIGIPAARKINNAMYLIDLYKRRILKK